MHALFLTSTQIPFHVTFLSQNLVTLLYTTYTDSSLNGLSISSTVNFQLERIQMPELRCQLSRFLVPVVDSKDMVHSCALGPLRRSNCKSIKTHLMIQKG